MLQLKGLKHGFGGHIVAEMRDVDDEPLVRMVGGTAVETVVSHDIVGRLMLMAVRQPGLANVYESILGFEGHEFYLKCWPQLAGLPFGELAARFADAVPLGIKVRAARRRRPCCVGGAIFVAVGGAVDVAARAA